MYGFSKIFYGSFLKKGIDNLDHIIKLPMGDNFVQPITVDELIKNFGYPKVTDSELHDIAIDNYMS